MKQTQNYKLSLIERNDPFDVNPINENITKIDELLNTMNNEVHQDGSKIGDTMYSLNNPGDNWVPCSGQPVDSNAYPELFKKCSIPLLQRGGGWCTSVVDTVSTLNYPGGMVAIGNDGWSAAYYSTGKMYFSNDNFESFIQDTNTAGNSIWFANGKWLSLKLSNNSKITFYHKTNPLDPWETTECTIPSIKDTSGNTVSISLSQVLRVAEGTEYVYTEGTELQYRILVTNNNNYYPLLAIIIDQGFNLVSATPLNGRILTTAVGGYVYRLPDFVSTYQDDPNQEWLIIASYINNNYDDNGGITDTWYTLKQIIHLSSTENGQEFSVKRTTAFSSPHATNFPFYGDIDRRRFTYTMKYNSESKKWDNDELIIPGSWGNKLVLAFADKSDEVTLVTYPDIAAGISSTPTIVLPIKGAPNTDSESCEYLIAISNSYSGSYSKFYVTSDLKNPDSWEPIIVNHINDPKAPQSVLYPKIATNPWAWEHEGIVYFSATFGTSRYGFIKIPYTAVPNLNAGMGSAYAGFYMKAK